MKSLAHILRAGAEKYSDRPAVWFRGEHMSFDELNRMSNRVARGLQERGVGPGQRIALFCINSPHFMISYFAILKTGATVVPVNLLLHPNEIKSLLKDADVHGLIYHSAVEKSVLAIQEEISDISQLISIGETQLSGTIAFSSIVHDSDQNLEIEPEAGNDIAAILYTGGTTGLPKGAMLTHDNLLSNVNSVNQALSLKASDRVITVLPMFHSFGATVGFLAPVAAGACVIALPQFAPAETCQIIEQEKATVFLGVPTMYAMMANLAPKSSFDLSTLRICISGGAPLPMPVLERFEDRYPATIYEGYGPTECSPVVSVNPIRGIRKLGTVGVPIPDVDIKIVDARGKAVPERTIGEICVRGPNVMKGYWRREEETAAVFFDEWLRTGDLGFVDEDGFCTIVDRAKDLIIVHGLNVYPRQIEEVLYQHPAVAEAAVIGVADDLHGEMIKAFVAPRQGQTIQPREIIEFCRGHLGRFEIPRRVQVLDSLPKSAAGKILRRKLREQEKK